MSDIKDKLSKLLRMQSSSNVYEAANAASKLEELCRVHGISPDDVSVDHDPERDVVVKWKQGESFSRTDHAAWSLLQTVAQYFNGSTIRKNSYEGNRRLSYFEVIATQGNRIQIELYFDYLYETMERMADEAKALEKNSGRSYRSNYRKGWARGLSTALRQKKSRERDPSRGYVSDSKAIVLQDRDRIEKRLTDTAIARYYPKLGPAVSSTYGGNGTSDGHAAGRSTSIQKQVRSTKPKQLTGC